MNENRAVTILGTGSSGMATAAYLTLAGCRVTLCDTPEQAADFEHTRAQNGIILRGGSGKTGCVLPYKLTNSFEEALRDALCVIICTSAGRHEEIAERVVPLAREGQVFLINPGNFGSFGLRRRLDALGKENVAVAELCGCLWACRRTAPGEVLVAMPAKEGTVAALPAADTQKVIDAFAGIWKLNPGKNVLEVSLNSPNVISHVAGAVLNATPVEKKGEQFAFFMDGLSETVIQTFIMLEEERKAVMDALELRLYGASSEGLMRKLMSPDCPEALYYFRSLDGPSSFAHRYVSEDAACGVAMLVSLGQAYGVPTPLTHAYLTIAQSINREDYLRSGRTLESLNLTGLSKEALLQSLA